MLQCVEVSSPKTINITQYLNTNNFSVNNRHFVIKSSQTTQLYITNVFYKQFSCHHHIKNIFSSQILLKLTFSDSVQSHD
jgi:hypothetical protein